MKRPLALLVALVAVASIVSGCGSNGGPSTLRDAATMRYTLKGKHHTLHVSRARLLSEVRSLVDNAPFAKILKDQDFTVSHDLSADSKITAIWLSQLIQQETIDALFASRHLRVTADGRSNAAKTAAQLFPGEAVFPAFSAKFRAILTDRQARTEAVVASYADTSEAGAKAYFRSHQAQFGCASGKNVAHILLPTNAAAQAVVDQLAAGSSFETIAREKSTDTQSGAQGGSLGCLNSGQFIPAFQTAADAAPIGTPVGPVRSSAGFHVILVTKAPPTKFEDVRAQVVEAVQQDGSQKFGAAVNALYKRYKVHLDPRFGTWGVTTGSQGQPVYQVTPPKAPAPATSRDGTTTTVTVAAAPTGSP
jgi:hypothetical protein